MVLIRVIKAETMYKWPYIYFIFFMSIVGNSTCAVYSFVLECLYLALEGKMANVLPDYSQTTSSDDGDILKTAEAKGSNLVVAAIDFGTTYSGYAYALKTDFEKGKILANHKWTGEEMVTEKAPTIVLFDKDGHFHSFGYEAEKRYSELADAKEHEGWQYFRRFKMVLNQTIRPTRDMVLFDDQGHTKPALEVFSAAIEYLKKHLMDTLQSRLGGIISDSDVHWILTVPAIWNDGAKQFMAEAATKAGIPQGRFALALEPECAAIFCKETAVYNQSTQKAVITKFAPGSQYMIVDMGGGTVDITAHEIDNNRNLKELYPPTGGPWGGILVDETFDYLLQEWFTSDVMETFKSEYKEDEMYLNAVFELKKRVNNTAKKASTASASKIVMLRFPPTLIDLFHERKGESFESSLRKNKVANKPTVKTGKFQFTEELFASLFDSSIKNILKHLREILAKPELIGIDTLMLVGGFAESERVKSAITDEFSKKRVITPDGAGLSIVKGAVMFGFTSSKLNLFRHKREMHNPDSTYHLYTCISSRKLPYTYGIAAAISFDKWSHPLEKKTVRYGQEKCEDIFKVFITRGTDVVPGESFVKHTFNSPYRGAAKISVEIFKSTEICPRFTTDDGCTRIGELVLQLSTRTRDDVGVIDIKMLFGDTQLEVEACQHGRPGVSVAAEFDFLS